MKNQELLQWAIKGLRAEINELEKQVQNGKNYLKMLENGEKPPTKLSANEIQAVINEKRAEIEKLDRKRFDFQWELTELEEKEQ